jgi:hypothetical protein
MLRACGRIAALSTLILPALTLLRATFHLIRSGTTRHRQKQFSAIIVDIAAGNLAVAGASGGKPSVRLVDCIETATALILERRTVNSVSRRLDFLARLLFSRLVGHRLVSLARTES